ncbi:hypothetical protein G7046_g2485 [Stylonectria norvegica]|nr:hypothetical protein G7046_g2485 [Stylonectria norvegica]
MFALLFIERRLFIPANFGTSEALLRHMSSNSTLEQENSMILPPSTLTYSNTDSDLISWPSMPWLVDHVPEISAVSVDEMLSEQDHFVLNPSLSQSRVDNLIRGLSSTHETTRLQQNADSERFDTVLARSVFTPGNIQHFTRVFFSQVQPYHPILHPPTFDVEMIPLPLLLSVVCMGSLFSAPFDSAISVRSFFDTAEAYIYNHVVFRTLLERTGLELDITREETQAIQAALTILVVQMGINDESTRRRIRLQRQPTLNQALRLSGLIRTKHPKRIHRYTGLEWDAFIQYELAIRLMACCFNLHPVLMVPELVGDMPCSDRIFEARSATEFEQVIALDSGALRPQSLATSVELLLQDSWPGSDDTQYQNATSPALFSVICCRAI